MNAEREAAVKALADALRGVAEQGMYILWASDPDILAVGQGEDRYTIKVEYPDGDDVPEVMINRV